jgi:CubicO group peptidase (beta-lactamase class C family)
MIKNLTILIAALAALMLGLTSCGQDQSIPTGVQINTEIERLMVAEDVKGLAIAVIENGEIVHVEAYGHRNIANDLLLETDTIMYGASITKTAVGYMVLQLVDEGVFDLDRPLADYLPMPLPEMPLPADEDYHDLDGDDRWRKVTARHVLTHSTGFANFRWLEDDQKLRFHFEPGERYGYSGEGFYILQLALEQGLGLDLKEEMQRRIFDRFGMVNTSMQWRADFAKNLADGYAMDGSFEPHDERSGVSAAGSMDTTIADQARMWQGFVTGEGLTEASRAEFTRPGLSIYSARQFPTLSKDTDPRGEKIGLSAGLGNVTFQAPNGGLVWIKGGHNPWTGNMGICVEQEKRCVVMLANSVRAELIYPQIFAFILGDINAPWWWKYGVEYP